MRATVRIDVRVHAILALGVRVVVRKQQEFVAIEERVHQRFEESGIAAREMS